MVVLDVSSNSNRPAFYRPLYIHVGQSSLHSCSFFFNRTRDWFNPLPDLVFLNGTVRCQYSLAKVTKIIPFQTNLIVRRVLEIHFCQSFRDVSWSEVNGSHRGCYHANESTDQCNEWNPCMSITRIDDGWKNCFNGLDESARKAMKIEQSCARVRRHRFRCSIEQATCLSVTKLGDSGTECRNAFDQFWFGFARELSSINCKDLIRDECSLLRQYIAQSWITANNSQISFEHRISFRSYCDTFWNLDSRQDENLGECRRSWICPHDQWRCQTGQCIEPFWVGDGEWDCADASDEHLSLNFITGLTQRGASLHNFTNRSYFVSSTCNQSNPFLCLSATAIQLGFSCFNLSQIGDGQIDCAGMDR